VQIVELDALLAAKRLSDVLPGSGACCHLPRPAVALAPVTTSATAAERAA